MRVGIIGCGNISDTYFNCENIYNNIEVISCADIDNNISKKSGEKFNIKSESVDEILSNTEVELIINLTIPSVHKKIIVDSLNSGKHCFTEKPLAMNFDEGQEIAGLAKQKKLVVGSAPDTFLGATGQKARELIDKNIIGKVVLGTFNVMSRGMEDWHPNPDFFFKPGAGPVFDLGVYYITQLVNLLGPIKSINAISGTAYAERKITSQPRYGEKIKVETPTTLMGVLEFHSDVKIQFFCSWDVWKHNHSTIELYAHGGTMILPDPNFFSGDILLSKNDNEWQKMNNDHMLLGKPNKKDNDGKNIANYRGIGLSDMINSISQNIKPRCSLDLSLHVLEVMDGIIISSQKKSQINISTKPKKPEPLEESEIQKLLRY